MNSSDIQLYLDGILAILSTVRSSVLLFQNKHEHIIYI